MEEELKKILDYVKHKDSHVMTTTRKFKQDIFENLFAYEFKGNIIELGTDVGYTTAILASVAKILGRKVYGLDSNSESLNQTESLLKKLNLSKYCTLICKDIYEGELELDDIGCVFIDGDHTISMFEIDLNNVFNIINKEHIIIIHDYGLIEKKTIRKIQKGKKFKHKCIRDFLLDHSNKYEIIKGIGESKDDWAKYFNSGQVVDWEGCLLRIKERT